MKVMVSVICLFFSICTSTTFGKELNLEIVKNGRLSTDILIESRVINDKENLAELWNQMGEKSGLPVVDFKKESIIFIISQNENADKINVKKVEKRPGNRVDIFYSVDENEKSLSRRLGVKKYPYLLAKLPNPDMPKLEISLRENYKILPIPANNDLGKELKYTNILSDYQNLEILNYVPLDMGNKWTYKIESDKRNTEMTHEVQSVSNGWSILNSYFGKQNIAMKIERSGQLFVSSAEGVRSFYTDSVQKTFVTEEIETPAGKFSELMVVTIPRNDNFWFKDVYAKGVGLVYHEHISPKGNGKYTLLKARVRGKDYPG
jgi:hypothetical protein